jgi:hypothetical protein
MAAGSALGMVQSCNPDATVITTCRTVILLSAMQYSTSMKHSHETDRFVSRAVLPDMGR